MSPLGGDQNVQSKLFIPVYALLNNCASVPHWIGNNIV